MTSKNYTWQARLHQVFLVLLFTSFTLLFSTSGDCRQYALTNCSMLPCGNVDSAVPWRNERRDTHLSQSQHILTRITFLHLQSKCDLATLCGSHLYVSEMCTQPST
jgi:hypothetical protein